MMDGDLAREQNGVGGKNDQDRNRRKRAGSGGKGREKCTKENKNKRFEAKIHTKPTARAKGRILQPTIFQVQTDLAGIEYLKEF